MTPELEVFHGVVRGHAGTSPGLAKDITYKILINFPDGSREVAGIEPAIDRWPEPMKVVAIKPGTAVMVASVKGKLQLMARELPHIVPCETPSP